MITLKVSDVTGAALDWLVAKCAGKHTRVWTKPTRVEIYHPNTEWNSFTPSTDWSQGGPIIEREGIELLCNLTAEEAARFNAPGVHADWRAAKCPIDRNVRSFGVTPLIAAMRCYVASKLGDTVEVPDELQKED